MAAEPINLGPVDWHMTRDADYNREYHITYKVKVPFDETLDGNGMVVSRVAHGPGRALEADGLPVPGDTWSHGDDNDGGAWCRPNAEVRPQITGEPWDTFLVDFVYSSKPLSNCIEGVVDDPLLQPPVIGITSQQAGVEPSVDRFGSPILYSSHEPIRGREVEFKRTVKRVKVVQNIPAIDPALDAAENHVNGEPMWGYAPRCVLLAKVSQDCKCTGRGVHHVEATMEFDIDPQTHDKILIDEGAKCIRGNWVGKVYVVDPTADAKNPQHFEAFRDYRGNPCRVILDGNGAPADVAVFRGALFASLADDNVGHPLSDSAWWLPIAGPPAGEDWAAGHGWKAGQVVIHLGHWLIALTNVSAAEDFDPLTQTELWLDLGTSPPTDGFFYSESGLYPRGFYVKGTEVRGPGSVRVEYFPETDLLLLPVPVSLECGAS